MSYLVAVSSSIVGTIIFQYVLKVIIEYYFKRFGAHQRIGGFLEFLIKYYSLYIIRQASSFSLRLNNALTIPTYQITLNVSYFYTEIDEINLKVKLPDSSEDYNRLAVGSTIDFNVDEQNHRLVIKRINRIKQKAHFEIWKM